jgi:ribosomal protein S12 methylthiotransferase accessory factor
LSTACDTTAFGALKNFANNGGVSTTRRRAIGKAMGEAVERYCAAQFDEEALVYAAFDELDRRATPPESYALYRPEQYAAPGFPWKPFGRDTHVAWTPGRSLVSGEEVLVPAAAVFVPYHYRHARGDAAIMQPISTGLACGPSRAAATLSALCEAIERDAFTITWQAGLSRPRVARDGVPAMQISTYAHSFRRGNAARAARLIRALSACAGSSSCRADSGAAAFPHQWA